MSSPLLDAYLSANRVFTLAGSLGVVLERRGMHAFLTGAPFASFNNVWLTGRAGTTAQGGAVAYLRDCGLPLSAIVPTDAPPGAADVLSFAGLTPMVELPLMHRPLSPDMDGAPDVPGVVFRQLSAKEAPLHCRVAAAAFGMPSDSFDPLVPPEVLTVDGVSAFVAATSDGTAVTTVLSVRAGTAVAIFNLATEPGSRKRGYGSALMRYVLSVEAQRGASTGLLLAGAEAVNLYSSLGFDTAMTVTYHLPK